MARVSVRNPVVPLYNSRKSESVDGELILGEDNKDLIINNDGNLVNLYDVFKEKFISDYSTNNTQQKESNVIYGVDIDMSNSDPNGSVTYTNDSSNYIPLKVDGNTGQCNYGSWSKIINNFLGVKPCIMKNGKVHRYLNPNNYAIDEDGNAASIDGKLHPTPLYTTQNINSTEYVAIDDIIFDGTSYIGTYMYQIFKSSDLINWDPIYTSNNYFTKLYLLNNTIIATSMDNEDEILISSDGENWTTQNINIMPGDVIYNIVYVNGKYIAQSDAILYVSTDLISWNKYGLPFSNNCSNIIWDGERYVLLGYDSETYISIIYQSTNLYDWEEVYNSGSEDLYFWDIFYNNFEFVMIVYDYTQFKLKIYSSSRLISWNVKEINDSYETIYDITSVIYTGNKYVLLLDDNKIFSFSSFDSDDWSMNTINYNNTHAMNLVYTGSEYICFFELAYYNESTYIISNDLLEWNSPTKNKMNSAFSGTYTNLKCINGVFFLYDSLGDNSAISYNGLDWEFLDNGQSFCDIIYDGLKYIGSCQSGIIVTSTDLKTWTSIQTPYNTASLKSLLYDGDYYIVTGSNGIIAKSTNLTTWQTCATYSSYTITSIVYNGSVYVATSDTNRVKIVSTDLINWNSVVAGPYCQSIIVNSNNEFIASGYNGIFKSTDGLTWDTITSLYSLHDIIIDSDRMIGIGMGGSIYTSDDDGYNWTKKVISSYSKYTLTAICYREGMYLLYGTNNSVLYSKDLSILCDTFDYSNSKVYIDENNNTVMINKVYGLVVVKVQENGQWRSMMNEYITYYNDFISFNGQYVFLLNSDIVFCNPKDLTAEKIAGTSVTNMVLKSMTLALDRIIALGYNTAKNTAIAAWCYYKTIGGISSTEISDIAYFKKVIYNDGVIIGLSLDNNIWHTNTESYGWISSTLGDTEILGILIKDGMYLVYNSTTIYTLPFDFNTDNARIVGSFDPNCRVTEMIYDGSRFIAMDTYFNNQYFTSYDLINWTQYDSSSYLSICNIAYFDDTYYIASKNGLYKTTDIDPLDNNVMIEFKKRYYKFFSDNNTLSFRVSDYNVDGTYSCDAFMSEEDCSVPSDYMYYSVYEGYVDINDKLKSQSRKHIFIPSTETVTDMRTKATANGNKYALQCWAKYQYIVGLTWLVTKNLDQKEAIGIAPDIWDYNKLMKTGTMNSKGLFFGTNSDSTGVKIFGIENLYGNYISYCEGYKKSNLYIKYQTHSPYSDDERLLSSAGITYMTGLNYISKMEVVNNTLIPTTAGGASATYFSTLINLPLNNSNSYMSLILGSTYRYRDNVLLSLNLSTLNAGGSNYTRCKYRLIYS